MNRFSAAFHAFIWSPTYWQLEFEWRDQSACDIIFGFSVVCVSFRAYGLRWSIMAYDVRLSTETEVSLQKCNYIQIMVFPVVAIDKTDAGKKWLVGHWVIYTRGRHQNEASQTKLWASAEVLSFPVHFSAVSIGCHPKPHGQPFHKLRPTGSKSQAAAVITGASAFSSSCVSSPCYTAPRFINQKDHLESCLQLFPLRV